MFPRLVDLGPLSLPSYYTLLTAGFMLVIYLAWRDAKRVGLDPDDVLDLCLYMLLGALIGARLLHVVADGYFWDYVNLCLDPLEVRVPSFIHVACQSDADCVAREAGALCHPDAGRCHPARDCFAALKFWHGGLAFYGGFLLSVGVAIWFVRRHKLAFMRMGDLFAWGIALGLVFGRTGCFLAGCCFGHVTDAAVGVEFPGYVTRVKADGGCPPGYDLLETTSSPTLCATGSPALLHHAKTGRLAPRAKVSLPVHPTQLYEAAFAALLFAYLYFYRRKRARFEGHVWWELCLLYGLGRFTLELFRDDERGLWLGERISTSQLIALPIIVLAAWMLWRGLRGAGPPITTEPSDGPAP